MLKAKIESYMHKFTLLKSLSVGMQLEECVKLLLRTSHVVEKFQVDFDRNVIFLEFKDNDSCYLSFDKNFRLYDGEANDGVMFERIEVEDIARFVQSLVREYNFIVYGKNYKNIKPFEDLSIEEKKALIEAVKREINEPALSNEDSHARWMKARQEDGWKYGEVLDRENKTHPNLIPYKELPIKERFKDTLFKSICKHFGDYIRLT